MKTRLEDLDIERRNVIAICKNLQASSLSLELDRVFLEGCHHIINSSSTEVDVKSKITGILQDFKESSSFTFAFFQQQEDSEHYQFSPEKAIAHSQVLSALKELAAAALYCCDSNTDNMLYINLTTLLTSDIPDRHLDELSTPNTSPPSVDASPFEKDAGSTSTEK